MWIACQPDPCKLPAFLRLEEIAIGSPNMAARRCAGTAAQNVLVAHKLAVVFAERARRGPLTWIRRGRAARPFPNVAKHLVKALIVSRTGQCVWMKILILDEVSID